MTATEFSNQFDLLFNNISSNQAPGLNEYEKSALLTKAQNEIVLNYFNAKSKGNSVQEGFDDTAIRQMDFSTLLRTETMSPTMENIDLMSLTDPRALVYISPTTKEGNNKIFIIVNEQIVIGGALIPGYKETYTFKAINNGEWVLNENTVLPLPKYTVSSKDELYKLTEQYDVKDGDIALVEVKDSIGEVKGIRQVIPIAYKEYMRLMSKPFKEPLKNQAWRLLTNNSNGTFRADIVLTTADRKKYKDNFFMYKVRYVKKPIPIILTDFTEALGEDLSIDGYTGGEDIYKERCCELPESSHERILQRAVELAKIAWAGNANDVQLEVEAGNRSE